MNSRRVVAGAIGLGAALAFASVVPESGIPGARLLAFVLAFLVVGTLDWFLSGHHSAEKVSRDTRAADGRAELAEVAGVRSEPNPIDARFGRFVGFESAARVAARDQEKMYPSTCPPLLGRVVIASWFLGRDGRGWSAGDAARSMATLLRVATWDEREAIRWGRR